MKSFLSLIAVLGTVATLTAAEHHGLVEFGQLPVPGASIRATQGDKTVKTLTGPDGSYSLPDLAEGVWTVQVEMPGFESSHREVTVKSDASPLQWDLKMLPLTEHGSTAASPGFTNAPATPALQVLSPGQT